MMSYCAYSDCQNKYLPCSRITFFNLPKDDRRQIWIENSGNPELLSLKPSSNKQFCEKHFDPKYLRRQFTRTVLRKDAVPYKVNESRFHRNIQQNDRLRAENAVQRPATVPTGKHKETNSNNNESEGILDDHLPSLDNVVTLHALDLETECLQEYAEITNILDRNSRLEVDHDTDKELEKVEFDNSRDLIGDGIRLRSVANQQYDECPEDFVSEAVEPLHETVAESDGCPKDYDEDMHYSLSLLGYFKRLPPKTKAIAKLKILQYLTELRFENTSNALD